MQRHSGNNLAFISEEVICLKEISTGNISDNKIAAIKAYRSVYSCILSLVGASGCKGLVFSVGPFLTALSGSNIEASYASGSFDQIVLYLSNNPAACLAFGLLAISAALFGVASSWAISRYTNCLALDLQEYGLKQALNEPYIIHTSGIAVTQSVI